MEKKLIDAVQFWAFSVKHKLDRELTDSERQLRDAWNEYAFARAGRFIPGQFGPEAV